MQGEQSPNEAKLEKAHAFTKACGTADATLRAAIRHLEDFGIEEPKPAGKEQGRDGGVHFNAPVNVHNFAVATDSAVQRISHLGDKTGADLKEISDLLQQSQDLAPNQVRQGVADVEALAVEVEKPEEKRNWKSVLEYGQRVLDLAGKAVDLGDEARAVHTGRDRAGGQGEALPLVLLLLVPRLRKHPHPAQRLHGRVLFVEGRGGVDVLVAKDLPCALSRFPVSPVSSVAAPRLAEYRPLYLSLSSDLTALFANALMSSGRLPEGFGNSHPSVGEPDSACQAATRTLAGSIRGISATDSSVFVVPTCPRHGASSYADRLRAEASDFKPASSPGRSANKKDRPNATCALGVRGEETERLLDLGQGVVARRLRLLGLGQQLDLPPNVPLDQSPVDRVAEQPAAKAADVAQRVPAHV